MSKHLEDERVVAAENVGVPTQVANPRRTSWRTFVQSAIGGLIALNALLATVAAFLAENSEAAAALLGEWFAPTLLVVNTGVAVGAFAAKLIAQIMANPIVNAWISTHLPWLAPIREVAQ